MFLSKKLLLSLALFIFVTKNVLASEEKLLPLTRIIIPRFGRHNYEIRETEPFLSELKGKPCAPAAKHSDATLVCLCGNPHKIKWFLLDPQNEIDCSDSTRDNYLKKLAKYLPLKESK